MPAVDRDAYVFYEFERSFLSRGFCDCRARHGFQSTR